MRLVKTKAWREAHKDRGELFNQERASRSSRQGTR